MAGEGASWVTDEFVDRAQIQSCFIMRIPAGANLIQRLRALIELKEARRAAILSAVGSVRDVTFRNLKQGVDMPIDKDKIVDATHEGPFELLSLEGNVIPMAGSPVVHLHAVLGTPDGTVLGGHVFDATVFTTVEVVAAEITNTFVVKARDEATGMAELRIAE